MAARLMSNESMTSRPGVLVFALLVAGLLGLSSTAAAAQTASLPDAPDARPPAHQQDGSTAKTPDPAATDQGDEGKQTKRILGIIPNFRSVSVNVQLPPQSAKEKFIDFAQDSFDYSALIFVGILSGVSQAQDSTPEFHSGAAAYGRYYWHIFADQTDENLWVEFLLPVALHEDGRYYTLGRRGGGGHNSVLKRAGYAFSRILVTRTDAGGQSINFSEIVGAGAASGISNLYYPASNRSWTKTGQRWSLNMAFDAGTFVFKEFWPDINHAVFHRKQPSAVQP
jgi:hypothetical protein